MATVQRFECWRRAFAPQNELTLETSALVLLYGGQITYVLKNQNMFPLPTDKVSQLIYKLPCYDFFLLSSFNWLQVAIAFWRAMGGGEEEIAGLGEDDDN